MAIKVKAVERELKVGKDAGKYRFMMQAEIYTRSIVGSVRCV